MTARQLRAGAHGRALGALACAAVLALAADPRAQEFDPEQPYTVLEDGTVGWYVYNGYRRYHSECHVCHGPDGLGSSFAPALVNSLERLSYQEFLETVANGRVNPNTGAVMPSFGTNLNVMCFVNDIYAYLKARSDGAIGRGRPAEHLPKPPEAAQQEEDCLGL